MNDLLPKFEFFIAVSELGTVGTSIVVPVMIPVSASISVALTCSAILKSINRLLTKNQ